ncbi:MAG: tetratricopeptide repeat protein [Acidobacteriota bacterium]
MVNCHSIQSRLCARVYFRKLVWAVWTSVLMWLLVVPFSLSANPQAGYGGSPYARGAELARTGRFEEALVELRRAVEQQPADPRPHNMIGVVLTQMGKLDDANTAYSQALEIAPNFVPARKNRAVNAFTQRNFQFALKEFQALAQAAPRDFVPYLFLGLLSLESLDFEAADRHLGRAATLAPGNPKILVPLTRVRLILGKRESALELARKAESVVQTDAERQELGVILAQFEANSEAEALFRELRRKQPDSSEVAFNLALVEYRLGKFQQALQTIQSFGTGRTLTGDFLNLRGWVYNKMRRWDEARVSLEEAIQVEPNNPNHYLDLSVVLRNAGDTDKAIGVVRDGLGRGLDWERLQLQLGLLYQRKKDNQKAEECFREVLNKNSAHRSAYLALANLMALTDRQPAALALLKSGVEKLPSDALLRYMYGGQLLDAGYLDQADAELKEALQLNPLYANTYYLLGKLRLKQGQEDTARMAFEKACAFNPEHVGAYYQLSLIARRQGDKQKAQSYHQTVQRLNEQADKEYQESFHGTVDESLQPGSRAVVPARKP